MGEVKEYQGRPEIILETPNQIELGKWDVEEFEYWITMGDADPILGDLANLVKEIKGELPKSKMIRPNRRES